MRLGQAWRTMFVCGLAGAGVAVVATAGPLTPPAGSVAPTYKTLTEVEPRIAVQSLAGAPPYFITQPGSYYLTGNVSAVAGQRGIYINADNVTLDLNGFAMIGNLNSDDAVYFNGRRNVTVRNGVIRDWVKEGIDGFGSNNVRLENITVDNCPNGFGVIVGDGARIVNSSVSRAAAGFITGSKATLVNCTAEANTGTGFSTGLSANLQTCTADGNTGDGFVTGAGTDATSCIARANGGHGFSFDGWAGLNSSVSVGNTGSGIRVIAPGGGGTNGASILNCTVSANAGAGVEHYGAGATIRGCTVSRNTFGAASLGSLCHVVDNNFQENGTTVGDPPPAYQIYVAGAGTRIDNNHFSSGSGISALWLNGIDNLVTRNTFVGPGGVLVGGSNANNEIALVANSPGQNFTNTNAWANFKY